MARCCGGTTCACKVEAGRHVEVTGTGTAGDPFVIDAQTHLTVEDNTQFNLVLTGSGTLAQPWLLSVEYAGTGGLDGLPDVDTTGKTNAQVLGWDDALGQWTPRAPTTAAPGAITVGNGVDGDGSAGDPLVAVGDTARYITVTASGIGLSDSGINRMVRVFSTEFARDNANPVPIQGTVAIVETDTSVLWYYDGADWQVGIRGEALDNDGQLLSTSGAYAGGPTTKYIRQLSVSTDGTGAFVAIPAANLTDYSGVLSCRITPTGAGTAWQPMITTGGGGVNGKAVRMTDGTALAGATITAVVEATLY
jgi:hypothetical protein